MNAQRAAEIQVVLEGIRLPATRDELRAYAARWDPHAASELARIPDRSYRSIDDVGEVLLRTQPRRREPLRLPRAESGAPPGHGDYVNPRPESGAVPSA